MQIGILSNAIAPETIGGTETQTANLAKYLAKKHKVTVYIRAKRGLAKWEQRGGFTIKRTGSFSFNLPTGRNILSTLNQLRKDSKKIGVLICMSIEKGFIGVLAKKLYKLPVITWIRGGDWYLRKSFLSKLTTRFTLDNSDLVLAQTNKIKKEVLSKHPKTKVEVLSNGVEITNQRANGNKIIFVGNLIERKGVKYLIKVMRKIKETQLLIIGDGSERKNLEAMAKGLNVKFIGKVPPKEVINYLKQGKILVLPAIKGEGLPNVILEAMSLGLPIITTPLAGIPDVVKNNKTGFLVKPKDVGGIVHHLQLLLKNEKVRKKMSKNCLKEAKKYSWKVTIPNLENLLSDFYHYQ